MRPACLTLALLAGSVTFAAPRDGKDHWAYQPLKKPDLPAVKDATWAITPVDRFLLARLEALGMKPSGAADKPSLIRRVTFDLTGLPPTPEAIDAFVTDDSPKAYEKVVDRLLASSRYGERWARHWMDVAHYAETHGHDQDAVREHAWPYRDYLITSFNDDKAYPRFVQEQVAGDVLFPDDPRATVALGFLAAGPWDESSQQDIRDEVTDKKIAQYLDRDDMVTAVMSTFVSTSAHCARCHHHKHDPIKTEEYYGLQAVFAGVDRANRAYDDDSKVTARRRKLMKDKADLQQTVEKLKPRLLGDEARTVAANWEKTQAKRQTRWVVLQPTSVKCANGSKPETRDDGSVQFGGMRPDVDTYTIEATTDLKGVTAVRLEVMTADTLPHGGPGRQDNGNLHLNEFRVEVLPERKGEAVKAALRNPTADFNQEGWTIAHAIDGKPKTAWGIYPAVGKPHEAAFEFAEPVGSGKCTTLRFVLEQTHGGGHLIGRLRLSATTAPKPISLAGLPAPVAAILDVPADKRTDAQKAELALHALRAKVDEELAALPPPKLVYAATADFTPKNSFKPAKEPRAVFVLRRGDVNKPEAAAVPGALSCVSGLEGTLKLEGTDEAHRRAALARWLTDPKNALAWRSIVNRVWHYHFGQGIVDTPNDFGKLGGKPSHPELLDWLAVHFRDDLKGSLKKLHRLLVTSAAYRQSSRPDARVTKLDADNRYLWRMKSSRLDAESVRDAVLAVSGKLDPTMGGPSVKHFVMSKGIHVTPNVDYQAFDADGTGAYRRSVYRFVFRTLPDPFLDALDCPDASQFMPVRASSLTPLQALALLNDKFVVRQSEHFAARLEKEAKGQDERVRRAYLLALGRPPGEKEASALMAYATKHGLANACRVLFNCNEFVFVP